MQWFLVQSILEQPRFELRGSAYTRIFFNKYCFWSGVHGCRGLTMYGSMVFYIGYLSIHGFGYPQESLNKISTDIERQLSFEESNIMRIFWLHLGSVPLLHVQGSNCTFTVLQSLPLPTLPSFCLLFLSLSYLIFRLQIEIYVLCL